MTEPTEPNIPQEHVQRQVDHDEAKRIAQRLISGSFRRDGERLPSESRPRFAIPCRPEHDDDCLILAYIEQCAAHDAELDAARAEIATLKEQLADAEIDANAAVIVMNKAVELSDQANAELARLRSAAPSGDLRAEISSILDLDGRGHARHNLNGALIDLDAQEADKVCRSTIRRVIRQLADVESALASTQPDATISCPVTGNNKCASDDCTPARCYLQEHGYPVRPQPDAGARGEEPFCARGYISIHEIENGCPRHECWVARRCTDRVAPSPSPEAAPPSGDAMEEERRVISLWYGPLMTPQQLAELRQIISLALTRNDRAERMLAALKEPSEETVEVVAKAIWDDGLWAVDPKWEELNDNTRHAYKVEARASIAALHDLLASIAETQAQESGQ